MALNKKEAAEVMERVRALWPSFHVDVEVAKVWAQKADTLPLPLILETLDRIADSGAPFAPTVGSVMAQARATLASRLRREMTGDPSVQCGECGEWGRHSRICSAERHDPGEWVIVSDEAVAERYALLDRPSPAGRRRRVDVGLDAIGRIRAAGFGSWNGPRRAP